MLNKVKNTIKKHVPAVLLDKRGDGIQNIVVTTLILGGFVAVYFGFIRPALESNAQRLKGVMDKAGQDLQAGQ
ncbi:hypothetical protein JCM39194_25450 [Desulfotomaculum varum]